MLKWRINRTIDLTSDAMRVERLRALATLSTRIAHELHIGVLENKVAAELDGLSVKLSVILPDKSSLMDAFDGKIDGHEAVMTLPDICYSQKGEVKGVLYLADSGGGVLPVYAFVLLVAADLTDIFIDPANVVPSISELLAQMETMREVTTAAQTATQNANTAAKKLSDIDVEVTMLENGSEPSGSVVQTENSTTFQLQIPIGPQGAAGTNGQTPYIGENGNWWIGNTDTGTKAQGPAGENGTGRGTVTAVTVSGKKYEPDGTGNVDLGELGGGDVQTVCGVAPDEAGNVVLDASHVGALPTNGTAANSYKLDGKDSVYFHKKFSNPRNLLDNSDFRNPVNQRGDTSYTGRSYSIDRWIISIGTTATIEDGYITLTNTAASGRTAFEQVLPDKHTGETLTIAICEHGTGKIYCGAAVIPEAGESSQYVGAADFDGHTVRFGVGTSGVLNATLMIKNASTINVDWMAVYEGAYTADNLPPYVPKGYAAELAECQRYFNIIREASATAFPGMIFNKSTARITIGNPVQMRTKPTVTIDDISKLDTYTTGGPIIPTAFSCLYGMDNKCVVLALTIADGPEGTPCTTRINTTISISADL